MGVSSVNSNLPVTPPSQPVVNPPAQDADRDGDSDAGGAVRASTPPGVGGLVDKDV
jgi:hypothetical protein